MNKSKRVALVILNVILIFIIVTVLIFLIGLPLILMNRFSSVWWFNLYLVIIPLFSCLTYDIFEEDT